MLEIKLDFYADAFDDATDSFVDGDLQRAPIQAVNWTAERVQLAIRASMLIAFDNPTPFTLGGVALYQATPCADGGEPSALVYLRDDVAGFLELEQGGGVRTAGAPVRRDSAPSSQARPRRSTASATCPENSSPRPWLNPTWLG